MIATCKRLLIRSEIVPQDKVEGEGPVIRKRFDGFSMAASRLAAAAALIFLYIANARTRRMISRESARHAEFGGDAMTRFMPMSTIFRFQLRG